MQALTPEQQAQKGKLLAMVKAVHADGVAEINGRDYRFSKLRHKERRKIFAYYTHIAATYAQGDLSWLDSDEFEPIQRIIDSHTSLDGSLLDRIAGEGMEHWDREEYAQDYVQFYSIALLAFSYPFLDGAPTG